MLDLVVDLHLLLQQVVEEHDLVLELQPRHRAAVSTGAEF